MPRMNTAARKLTDFLERERIAQATFATRVRVRKSTITRLLNGERRPSLMLAQRIFEQTNWNVTPSDWVAQSTECPSAHDDKELGAEATC